MAGVLDDKKLTTPVVKNSAAPAAAQTTAQSAQVTQPKQPANLYAGVPGLSESTQSVLGSTYQASQNVTLAQDYLNSVISGKPGDYSSNYKQQLDDIYNQVMNRPKFTYDLNGDMLYQQYKNQYQNLGKQAMMDTTAQAAALTGGYGNSYAATAGNQAYQSYLQQLNNIVPELYDKAYGRYAQEGQDLMDRFNLTQSLENADYAKYRDLVSDWQNERDYANTDYWNKYNADYGSYMDNRNMAMQLGSMENAQYNSNRDLAYNQAMAIIQTGRVPDQGLLDLIGLTKADAKGMAKFYKKKISSSGGGGGGGGGRSYGGGSGGGSGSGSGSYELTYQDNVVKNVAKSYKNQKGSTQAVDFIEKAAKNGTISSAAANQIKRDLGL